MKEVTYEEVAEVLEGILRDSGSAFRDVEFVVGVSRGGLFPAMVISTRIVRPLVIAYINKNDEVYFDRAEWIKNKKVLLVDDIVRTGKTMGKIKELLIKRRSVVCSDARAILSRTSRTVHSRLRPKDLRRHHVPLGRMTPIYIFSFSAGNGKLWR